MAIYKPAGLIAFGLVPDCFNSHGFTAWKVLAAIFLKKKRQWIKGGIVKN